MPDDLQDEDESVRIAVRALGDMRNSRTEPAASTSDSNSSSFVARVTHLPIVNSALHVYEQGKASSRVVKYGAEMVESSVKTISRPVIDRLPVNVNQLDEFACRQLDRVYVTAHSPLVGAAPPPPDDIAPSPTEERQVVPRSRWQAVLLEAGGLSAALSEESMRRLQYCLHWLQYATSHIDAQILILRDFTASLQPLPSSPSSTGTAPISISQAHLRTLAAVRRDIVQTIRQVVDVVSRYAGGALPEPARTRVRGFILELPQRWARKACARDEDVEPPRDRDREREKERESVAAAGRGTGGAIRRGRRAGHRERGTGAGSTPSSRATSPIGRHAHAHVRHQEDATGERETVPASTAIVAAQRILTLATESLDMMRGVTGVVKDSLDRADAWVGRLRTVGIQRTGTQQAEEELELPSTPRSGSHTQNSSIFEDPESGHGYRLGHRRGQSSGSHSLFDELEGSSSPHSGASSVCSIPSTPGAAYTFAQSVNGYGGYPDSALSPGLGLGLGAMSLADSRYSTPRSLAKGLPDDEEGAMAMRHDVPGSGRNEKEMHIREVKIVGMDVESGGEDGPGAGKMEIDA